VKGALVEFTTAFGATVPNVIVFQFNPETLRRTWTQPEPRTKGSNPLGVSGMPGESYSLTLLLDSDDAVADAPASPAGLDASGGGLGSRLAALEMLLFPVPPAADATGRGAGARGSAGSSSPTPAGQMPAVLFVWGPARILPVRITALTITETLFDALLHPTRATAELGFRVLTSKELTWVTGPFKNVANAAYNYSQGQRQFLALANLQHVKDVVGLPRIPGT
jgi:hypothetical protein